MWGEKPTQVSDHLGWSVDVELTWDTSCIGQRLRHCEPQADFRCLSCSECSDSASTTASPEWEAISLASSESDCSDGDMKNDTEMKHGLNSPVDVLLVPARPQHYLDVSSKFHVGWLCVPLIAIAQSVYSLRKGQSGRTTLDKH